MFGNSQEAIRSKTRLIAIDALFGCCGSNTFAQTSDCAPNSLIVSRDTVAVDYVGTEMLNEQRAKRNLQPKSVPLLEMAAEMGLGTNDPEKMEVLKVDLGPKAVEPADSYETQWGRVKDREGKRP